MSHTVGDRWVHDGPGHEGCPGRGDVWEWRGGYWQSVGRVELPVHGARASAIGYSEGPPVKVRVFNEGDHWAIDWADAVGNYSEVVWTGWATVEGFVEFATKEAALVHVPDFMDDAGLPGDLPIVVLP